MLDPARAGQHGRGFIDRVRGELFSDRLYALTAARRGRGTCLAARHRWILPITCTLSSGTVCRGARVNGRIAPLNQPLANGEIRRDHYRAERRTEPRLAGD